MTPPGTAYMTLPQAGGTGLNLVGAGRLILFDPSWNPAVDEQVVSSSSTMLPGYHPSCCLVVTANVTEHP